MNTMFRSFSCVVIVFQSIVMVRADSKSLNHKEAARAEVLVVETRFIDALDKKDYSTFANLLDEDCVFLDMDSSFHGRDQVIEKWVEMIESEKEVFRLVNRQVEVIRDGTLAMTSGTVWFRKDLRVGPYVLIWRRSSNGVWKIIFERGIPADSN
ncbi:YybH family protein [Nibricoccus sp. IMCC34717]|uniref:YybH family protein n=1 Tax=Nibricoccus sp. IMCC34717 TaxID=3034021 RepID=UPI00384C946C